MTGITRCPMSVISYFQTEHDNVITYMGRNLILNSINRGLAIRLYMKKVMILWTKFLHRLQFDTIVNRYFNQFSTSQHLQRLEEPIQLWVLFDEIIDIFTNKITTT